MKNYDTAIERYGLAADEGDPAAKRKLGKVLLSEGLRYMQESALGGDAEALEELEELLEQGRLALLEAREQGDGPGRAKGGQELQAGNTMPLGHLPGREEAIQWQVLEVQEDRALLLSHCVLEYRPFHERWGLVTWETASLRRYLNEEFFKDAFSDKEQCRILKAKVTADENPMCNTDPGNETKDRVFLLSVLEAEKYLPSNNSRRCLYWQADKSHNPRYSWWWLRSPGFNEANAASTGDDGSFQYSYVRDVRGGIRPAIWIKL